VAQLASKDRSERRAGYRYRGWVLLATGAVAAVAATHLVDYGVYNLRYRALNANLSESWSHVLDAGALLLGALVCLAGAWRSRLERATWAAVAVVLLLFSVDEVSSLHAEIGSSRYGKLLYAPVLAVLVYGVWRLTRRGPYRAVVRAGAAVLSAAYVIHVLDPHHIARALGWRDGGWAFQCVVALKEGTELAGVLLILGVLCATVAAREHASPARGPS
jgi:hypothetical protein